MASYYHKAVGQDAKPRAKIGGAAMMQSKTCRTMSASRYLQKGRIKAERHLGALRCFMLFLSQ